MSTADRKLAYSGIIVLAVIAAEIGWFLFVGPANSGPDQGSKQQAKDLFLGFSPEAWTAIFTGLLTFSTVGLWIQTRNAAREGTGSLTTIERGYIFLDFSPNMKDDVFTISLAAKNFGKTPGVIDTCWCAFLMGGDLPPSPLYGIGGIQVDGPMHLVLGSGTRETITDFSTEKGILPTFFYGRIQYRDMFNTKHEARFCIRVYHDEPSTWHPTGDTRWSGWS